MEKLAKWSCQTSPQSKEVFEKVGNFDQINCDSITAIDSNSSSTTPYDLMEDASSSSSPSPSPSPSSNSPLFQLSDLMAQLPIKRGLSKYYKGKSQSFTSLAFVERLEDLPKGDNNSPYKKRRIN